MLFLFSPILLCNAMFKCITFPVRDENNLQETHLCVSHKTGQSNTQLVRTDNEPSTGGVVIVSQIGGGGAELKTSACIFTEIMTVLIGKMSDAQVKTLNLRTTQSCVHFTLLKTIEDINISVIW